MKLEKLEPRFLRYEIDGTYGLMRIYALYSLGKRVGSMWHEPSAYLHAQHPDGGCGVYSTPEWVISLDNEPGLRRVSRDDPPQDWEELIAAVQKLLC